MCKDRIDDLSCTLARKVAYYNLLLRGKWSHPDHIHVAMTKTCELMVTSVCQSNTYQLKQGKVPSQRYIYYTQWTVHHDVMIRSYHMKNKKLLLLKLMVRNGTLRLMKVYEICRSIILFLFFFNFEKCCSGSPVLPLVRTFSSSQHVFDQCWSFTFW